MRLPSKPQSKRLRRFGEICSLVPVAEEVTKLTAVCTGCARPACFSRRLTAETAVEVIGGADKYIATCRACHQDPDLIEVLARRDAAAAAGGVTSAPSSPVTAPADADTKPVAVAGTDVLSEVTAG